MATTKMYLLIITFQIMYVVSAQEVAKRVPQGFLGMRGKKYLESAEMDHYYKRKPQFFIGVKGKKSITDNLEDEVYYKRAPMGFVGMRGKKEYYPIYSDTDLNTPNAGSLIGQIDYFTNDEINNLSDQEFPILNSIRKYLHRVNLLNAIDSELNSEPVDGRQAQYRQITNEVDKRAANIHQFFGVRGKKTVQNRLPYDLTFRGKFIGVRGKKDLKNHSIQEIKFLLDHNGPWPKRKAQMGFFGMRGKKWNDEATSEEALSELSN